MRGETGRTHRDDAGRQGAEQRLQVSRREALLCGGAGEARAVMCVSARACDALGIRGVAGRVAWSRLREPACAVVRGSGSEGRWGEIF